MSSSIPNEVPSAKISNQEVISRFVKNIDTTIPSESPITNPSYIKVKTLPRFLKQSLNSPSDTNNSSKQQPPIYPDEPRSILEAYQK